MPRKAKDGKTAGQRIAEDMPEWERVAVKYRLPHHEYGMGAMAVVQLKPPNDKPYWNLVHEMIAGDFIVCIWIRPTTGDNA